ncbi:hypothetical protein CKO44_15995 [Rubrivivax gelatinosus]|uniref:hypothetical protein n=1 Tax=Rubrivivax gelatinosus TaxID=28068 RepID=UPI0019074E44|nr:hypothetical protein [Rubrivivax gelatinosus]MBK1614971.1 hypothetical protein [Rubrivivax gelatinosus]
MSTTLTTDDLVAYARAELEQLRMRGVAYAMRARQERASRTKPWDSEIDLLGDQARAIGALALVAKWHGDEDASSAIDTVAASVQTELIDLAAAARAAWTGVSLRPPRELRASA